MFAVLRTGETADALHNGGHEPKPKLLHIVFDRHIHSPMGQVKNADGH